MGDETTPSEPSAPTPAAATALEVLLARVEALEQRLAARIDRVEQAVAARAGSEDEVRFADRTILSELVGATTTLIGEQRAAVATLEARIAAVATAGVDHSPVLEAIAGLPSPIPVDLRPVLDAVAGIPRQVPVDLAPVLDAVGAITVPEAPDPTPALEALRDDLALLRSATDHASDVTTTAVRDALDRFAAVVRPPEPVDLQPVLDAIADLPAPAPVDLTPVLRAIEAKPNPEAVDLGPVLDAVAALPQPAAVDLRPVLDALAAIPQPEPVDLAPVLSAIDALPDHAPAIERLGDAIGVAQARVLARSEEQAKVVASRVDQVRGLVDGVAAQVSGLHATVAAAAEEPGQLRRELTRLLDAVGDRIEAATRALLEEVRQADVAGAVRAVGESQREAAERDRARLVEAVDTVHDDLGDRLRRLDVQLEELRRLLGASRA